MEEFFSTYSGPDESAAEQFRRLTEILSGFRPEFIAPTLLNSWTNYGVGYAPVGYYKDPFERVHLKGLIRDGAIGVAFVLPENYRPKEQLIFLQQASDGTEYVTARVDVLTNGNVFVFGFAPDGAIEPEWVSLAGISFAAEQ